MRAFASRLWWPPSSRGSDREKPRGRLPVAAAAERASGPPSQRALRGEGSAANGTGGREGCPEQAESLASRPGPTFAREGGRRRRSGRFAPLGFFSRAPFALVQRGRLAH